MEEKLSEASSLLSGWKSGNGNGNGKHPLSKPGRDALEASRVALNVSRDR
jgi:hypothetical protein